MGANQTSTTNQTQTQTANPAMQQTVTGLLSQVPGVAATPYNQGMSPQVAAQNQQQISAIQGLGGLQTNNPANQYINQANQYSQQAADPGNINAMTNAFYNPMSSQVMGQFENIMGQQAAQLKGNEAASGAIGGSRASVADSTLSNQTGLAAGQVMSQLYNQALQAAQTQQGQISQQAFAQGQLGNEALNTGLTGINAALQGGNLTQQQQQAILNAAQTGDIQQTLFPQQELGAAANIAGIGTTLGGTTTGQGTTTQPVNYLGQALGAGIAGYGLYQSDERVKENIEPIGKSFDKQTIYKFNYIGDPSPRIGLMAQEVEKKHPGAVKEINGTKAVDYNKATAKSAEMGEHRLHRAIGGGTGIGNGTSGIEGFGGLQSGLAPYFAQSPQVNVPAMHFPTINLNPNDPNAAQKQADQNAQQMMTLGKDLSKGSLGSDISNYAGQQMYGGELGQDFGGGDTDFARGGRIHRPYGGGVNDGFSLPSDSWQGDIPQGPPVRPKMLEDLSNWQNSAKATMEGRGNTPSQPIEQDVTAQPAISDFIDRRVNRAYPIPPSLGATSLPDPNATPETIASVDPQATTMGEQSPDPLAYHGLDDQGRKLQDRPPPVQQQAAIASPAQTQTPASIATPPAQVLSQSAVDLIKREEGYRARPYQDGNRLSIGYGTLASSPNQILDPAHAEAELHRNLTPVDQWIKQNITANLTQPQKDALLSFGYNAGVGSLNNLKGAINSGDLEGASQAMLGYTHSADPRAQAGLEARRQREAAMLAGHPVQQGQSGQNLAAPKPGESTLDKYMAAFGMDMNKPQGLGGSLGRALGQNPSLSDQTSNRLVNAGIGMMAAGPSVGVKGFPGAAISALTSAGKGGQFALNQEQQERTQAINLANAAMNQKLHAAQIANYEREASQPRQIAHELVYDDFNQPHVLPIMGVPDPNSPGGWKQVPTTHASGSPQSGNQGGNMFDRINAIPSDLEGDAFVAEAKKQGITESLMEPANRVAHYKADPNKLFSYRDNRRPIVDALAARINKNYDPNKYPAIAATQKALDAGDVAKSNRAIGKLFDEADTTIDKAQNLHNWGLENANAIAGRLSPSSSKNTANRTAFGYAVDNLAEAGAAAAKGVGASNEGDVKRRYKLMNPDMHVNSIKAGILTEVETTLKMGQSNLTAYNKAHDYTPDNPQYLTVMDELTPAQQKKAVKLLGPDKVEEITGKPVPGAVPAKPAHLPSGTQYNAQRKQFRDPAGNLYDLNGKPING